MAPADAPAATQKKPQSRVLIATISLVNSAFYLAVLIWAEGGWQAYMAKPALVAFTLATLVAALSALFTRANISTGVKEDRDNRWALYCLIVLSLLGGVLPAVFDARGWWIIGGDAVRWAGVVIYVLGLVARLVPVFVLGRRFSGLVAIQPGHTLVTTGVYGLVRNPSYLGLIVMALGLSLTFDSWIGVVFTVLSLIPLIGRIDSEEKMLAGQFGEEFQAWQARTWRLIPWVY